MFQTVYTNPPSSAWYFATRLHRCFMWRGSNRDHEEVPRPYDRPEQPSFGTGVPASGFRQNRYLGPSWGVVINNTHLDDWYKSNTWEYWITSCLTEAKWYVRVIK
jgi:hypothetical protein